jgi:hypothetical protein
MTRQAVAWPVAAMRARCRAWAAVTGPIRPIRPGAADSQVSVGQGTARSSSPAVGRPDPAAPAGPPGAELPGAAGMAAGTTGQAGTGSRLAK